MTRLIQQLADGAWLFDEIVPSFLSGISGSDRLSFLAGRPVPSYVATLAYYRVVPEQDVLSALAAGAFEGRCPYRADERSVWDRLARTVTAECAPARLNSDENAALQNSWAELKSLDERHGVEFSNVILAMVPLENSDFGAASTPHLFGCIFMTREWLEQSFEKRMLSLVHELAHHELFALNLIDRLVNSSADYSLAHAPFQGKRRPPIGRLHAAHALFRMRGFQETVGWNSEETARLLAETCATFSDEELTPFAKDLVRSVYA